MKSWLFLMSAPLLAACGGNQPPAAAAEPEDTTLRRYEADDPHFSYTGRIDFGYPKFPAYSAPGVTVRARFKGNGVTVLVEDGANRNYHDVLLDGEPLLKTAPDPNVTSFAVATDLVYGEHELALVKRTEASIGRTLFSGVEIQGQLLDAPAPSGRRIEVIGDSISCGTGAEAPNGSPQCLEDGWGVPYNNARVAFGSVVARNLDADAHVTAVSGIGLVRNYSSRYDARPMPAVYDAQYLERMSSPAWDHARFVPDAILIVLGTNDFSPGDDAELPAAPRSIMNVTTYVEAYVAFVETLRGYYPNAQIFCISSPMLGDGWPDATYSSATDLKRALTLVEEHFVAVGDTRVHKFFVSPLSGRGCTTHPDVEQHAATAAELEPFVREKLGW